MRFRGKGIAREILVYAANGLCTHNGGFGLLVSLTVQTDSPWSFEIPLSQGAHVIAVPEVPGGILRELSRQTARPGGIIDGGALTELTKLPIRKVQWELDASVATRIRDVSGGEVTREAAGDSCHCVLTLRGAAGYYRTAAVAIIAVGSYWFFPDSVECDSVANDATACFYTQDDVGDDPRWYAPIGIAAMHVASWRESHGMILPGERVFERMVPMQEGK